ncbi:ribonuclease P protein component [Leucobacter aridicollis]|uniref:ribonuclease P protein component n=1 Tax=Leucobacter aridicollis TaxID=283878 RepID=UPI0021679EE5|nr:ribonuclease P protein component [Leucobacter aridicollis]
MPARHHRVTRGEDYRRVVRTGNRVGGALCITYAVPRSVGDDEEAPARFGFIISKAVGNAVMRNLIRRRMKSVADEFIRDGVTGVDMVFRALPKSASASFDEIRREMQRAVRKIRSE